MSWFISTVLAPVVTIGVLILVHELGHFLIAKLCGVGVVKFSIGFGPALLRWTRGDTQYQIGCIPLGGYVRMVGDVPDFILPAGEEAKTPDDIPPHLLADRSKWFMEKGLGARSAIVAAGPVFNLLSAMLFVAAAAFFYGEESPRNDTVIGRVSESSPASAAGLRAGDNVQALNGKPVATWTELARTITTGTGEPLALDIVRDGQALTLSVEPRWGQVRTGDGGAKGAYFIGIEPTTDHVSVGFYRSLQVSALWTMHATIRTYQGLWGMVAGKISPQELAGPIFIFQAAGQQARRGLDSVLMFMAILSVSLAVLNLLPIPVLDGGHLMFFGLEAIIGPISMRKKEIAQQLGLALLMLLMGFAITNDLRRDHSALKEGIQWQEKTK